MFRGTILVALLATLSTEALNVNTNNNFRPASLMGRSQAKAVPTTSLRMVALPLDIPLSDQTYSSSSSSSSLAPEDQWIAKLDFDSFGRDVTALGKELLQETGDADVKHLEKIVNWRNIAALIGLSTCWMSPNPITIAALSTWTYASWTMIAHHTCHGGYNRVEAGRFHSRGFGLGLTNRLVDWLDWIMPEAWNLEHGRLHHYRLNESKDPDLVQRNLHFLHDDRIPMPFRYAAVMFFLPIWKWYYYAPNTYKELKMNEWVRSGKELPADIDPEEAATLFSLIDPNRSSLRQIVKPHEVLFKVLGPMIVGRLLAVPALLCAIPGVGFTLAGNALMNLVLAELLTNVHAFVTIVTNHAGEDMYTYDDAVRPKTGSFYVRQIVGSVNYDAGSDPVDFVHGFLNYQIEHHCWPDLSMLQYQRGAPRLKAICEKHGVPYVQENVMERLRKTVDVMVGRKRMRPFPTQYEPAKDKAGAAGVTWKKTNGSIDED